MKITVLVPLGGIGIETVACASAFAPPEVQTFTPSTATLAHSPQLPNADQ